MDRHYVLEPYDQALKNILENGVRKSNRTGVDEISLFGLECRYDISKYFPVLTGRKLKWESAVLELLWILSGSTNNKDLQESGTEIWTPWISEEFEKQHNYEPGELGPVYGKQLRAFGGSFDQMEYLIGLIKHDPNSHRKLFSLWNPNDLSKQRLACCHVLFQVYIHEDKLSGLLFQRSADFPIGVPFNIIGYSTLIYLLCLYTGYKPGEFVHYTSESHIYLPQIDKVKRYLDREKPASPRMEIRKQESIYQHTLEDFELLDYNPLSGLKIPVAV